RTMACSVLPLIIDRKRNSIARERRQEGCGAARVVPHPGQVVASASTLDGARRSLTITDILGRVTATPVAASERPAPIRSGRLGCVGGRPRSVNSGDGAMERTVCDAAQAAIALRS